MTRLPRGSTAGSGPSVSGAYPTVTEPTRILVIDDEQAVRRVLHDLLASDSYLVHEAAVGAQGLD
jgi:PleD family two-component response regulator